jgi:hypothetical protein
VEWVNSSNIKARYYTDLGSVSHNSKSVKLELPQHGWVAILLRYFTAALHRDRSI